MIPILAFFSAAIVATLGVAWVYDRKQQSRAAPDRDGWREPEFLIMQMGPLFVLMGFASIAAFLVGFWLWAVLT